MNVLWVEDQLEDHRTFYEILERRGEAVRLSSTVQEAISLLRSEKFDLVLVDLNIPLGLGSDVESLVDLPTNGVYVLDAIEAMMIDPPPRVACLTNFYEDAERELANYSVEIIAKVVYLSEFEEIIYGN